MSQTPIAFLSYVNDDDKYANGKITQFRKHLSLTVKAHRGEPFEIFQDRESIKWGEQWQKRLDTSLDATTFLIPIITPSFFKSPACRAELKRFLKREKELGRDDLILPVYYIECPVLSDKAKQKDDELAQIIADRQYADWRELWHYSFTTRKIRKALEEMAKQIVAALERSHDESSRAEAVRQAETIKDAPASPQPEKESAGSVSQSNTFQSGGGLQSTAQGKGAIGTQNNYYYAPPPQDAKPQPAPTAKNELPTVVVDAWHRGDYTTITDALKAVKAGTRILVRPGLYRENIVIDKPVEIIGDGKRDDIVIEASDKHTVVFQADNGRLANLTLRQTGSSKWYAVDIGQGRLELEDCDISSQGLVCVAIHSGANPHLRRNRIHNGNKAGVYVYKNGQGTLEGNEIFANALAGVVITQGGNPTLRRNRISQNDWAGIWVRDKGGGTFEDNDLRSNTWGAWLIAPDCEAQVQRKGNKE